MKETFIEEIKRFTTLFKFYLLKEKNNFSFGFRFYKGNWIEMRWDRSLYGNRFPNFSRLGFVVTSVFDFYKPKKAIRYKEVPYDYDYEPP